MEHGNFSVLSYSAQSELDYGSVLCWAENELGKQERPCVFHLMPAGNKTNHLFSIENTSKIVKDFEVAVLRYPTHPQA